MVDGDLGLSTKRIAQEVVVILMDGGCDRYSPSIHSERGENSDHALLLPPATIPLYIVFGLYHSSILSWAGISISILYLTPHIHVLKKSP
jgi:hypothetical protein